MNKIRSFLDDNIVAGIFVFSITVIPNSFKFTKLNSCLYIFSVIIFCFLNYTLRCNNKLLEEKEQLEDKKNKALKQLKSVIEEKNNLQKQEFKFIKAIGNNIVLVSSIRNLEIDTMLEFFYFEDDTETFLFIGHVINTQQNQYLQVMIDECNTLIGKEEKYRIIMGKIMNNEKFELEKIIAKTRLLKKIEYEK